MRGLTVVLTPQSPYSSPSVEMILRGYERNAQSLSIQHFRCVEVDENLVL